MYTAYYIGLVFNTSCVKFKYVDDTTRLSVTKNVNDDPLQACTDHLAHCTQNYDVMANTKNKNSLYTVLARK